IVTLAETANNNDNYAVAEKLCNEVLASISENPLSSENENQLLKCRCLLLISISLRKRGYSKEAFPFAVQSNELAVMAGSKIDEAKALTAIGYLHDVFCDYPKALEVMEKALSIHTELGNKEGIATNLSNIGGVYWCFSDYLRSFEYFYKSLAICEEIGDKARIAINLGNIGNVYYNLSNYQSAMEYYGKSLKITQEMGNKEGISSNLNNIGNLYWKLQDYPLALEYHLKALAIDEEIGRKEGIASNLTNIGGIYYYLKNTPLALEYHIKSLSMYEELGRKDGVAKNLSNLGTLYKEIFEYTAAFKCFYESLALHDELGMKEGTAMIFHNIGALYFDEKYQGYDVVKAEEFFLKAISINEELGVKQHLYENHQTLAELYNHEKRWEEAYKHFEKFYEIEKEVQSDEVKKMANNFDFERKTAESEKALAIERARAQATDDILANILPSNIMERLIKGEKKIADTHHSVSVLFIDIVGFTRLSSKLRADELIDLLDIVFTRFDTICKKYGLEKIKTIGDAYMAVSGAPLPYENHAERALNAAFEMLEDFEIEQSFSVPINLGFRIGLHSGSVVAGIIGENKYSYDLWGDAVNTASRMESQGEEDKIHVSEDFLKSLKTSSDSLSPWERAGMRVLGRGEMEIKGKGIMKTYFIEK
ncbi:MAG: tetratricopeptide repeat protein, partial [Ignavibacteriae bacterium]|nr:tetratricopeptide repeat protein [Ignavibacteriota bacterium]